jgi:hypothetical protein
MKRAERQVAGTASAVQGQQCAAVHPGQDECGEGARQQRLPADPAQRGADAGGELGIPQAQATGPDDRQDQVEPARATAPMAARPRRPGR